MTIHIADIASYQQGLSLAALRAAGFTGINVKTSHGIGRKSVHPNVHTLVREARAAGWAIGTFHWLDASASGAAQAAHAFTQLQQLPGGAAGLAHTVDVESDLDGVAGEKIYHDYCATMTGLLGRRIATYTGAWWWKSRTPKPDVAVIGGSWKRAPDSPWLWSAPVVGYLPSYPGDTSSQWAGYGGWSMLTVMQYRVAPVAGIRVSQSAVAEDDWEAMTRMAINSVPASTSLLEEVNDLNAAAGKGMRDKASDGTIGDAAHRQSTSDHNPDETGNTGGVEDSDDLDEVHARDIDMTGPWPAGWSMERIVQTILARCRSGQEKRLRYIIFNKRIWSASSDWVQKAYNGSNPHDKHAHFSFRYGSGSGTTNPENITTPWGLLAAYEQEDDDMDAAEMTTWANGAGKASLGRALTEAPVGNSGETVGVALQRARAVDALVPQILTLVQNASAVDVQELAAAMGPIVTAGVVEQLPDLDGATPEEVEERVKSAVREVLGGLDNTGPATPPPSVPMT